MLQDGGVEVNAAKSDIDTLTQQLEGRKQGVVVPAAASSSSRSEAGYETAMVDDEQYQLLQQQLKTAKARWGMGQGGARRQPEYSVTYGLCLCLSVGRQPDPS